MDNLLLMIKNPILLKDFVDVKELSVHSLGSKNH